MFYFTQRRSSMSTENEKTENNLMEEQIRLLKKQVHFSKIAAAASVCAALILLIAALFLVPETHRLLGDMNTITEGLEDVDLNELVDNLNQLSTTSQDGINKATEKLEQLDVEGLSQAIQDLEKVISPLAKIFGK